MRFFVSMSIQWFVHDSLTAISNEETFRVIQALDGDSNLYPHNIIFDRIDFLPKPRIEPTECISTQNWNIRLFILKNNSYKIHLIFHEQSNSTWHDSDHNSIKPSTK